MKWYWWLIIIILIFLAWYGYRIMEEANKYKASQQNNNNIQGNLTTSNGLPPSAIN